MVDRREVTLSLNSAPNLAPGYMAAGQPGGAGGADLRKTEEAVSHNSKDYFINLRVLWGLDSHALGNLLLRST